MNDVVILMFAVFILYFLVPLIPAVIIYKLFPSTRVSAKGPFTGWNINTSGAFAAYIIALISGIFIVRDTIEIIKDKPDYVWQIEGKIKILNTDSLEVPSDTARKIIEHLTLEKNLYPVNDDFKKINDEFILFVTKNELINGVSLKFSANNCVVYNVFLRFDKIEKDKMFEIFDDKKIINCENICLTYLGEYDITKFAEPDTGPEINN